MRDCGRASCGERPPPAAAVANIVAIGVRTPPAANATTPMATAIGETRHSRHAYDRRRDHSTAATQTTRIG